MQQTNQTLLNAIEYINNKLSVYISYKRSFNLQLLTIPQTLKLPFDQLRISHGWRFEMLKTNIGLDQIIQFILEPYSLYVMTQCYLACVNVHIY